MFWFPFTQDKRNAMGGGYHSDWHRYIIVIIICHLVVMDVSEIESKISGSAANQAPTLFEAI